MNENKTRILSTYDMPKEHEIVRTPKRTPNIYTDILLISFVASLFGYAVAYGWTGESRDGLWVGGICGIAFLLIMAFLTNWRVEAYRETWWQQFWLGEDFTEEKSASVTIANGNAPPIVFDEPRHGEFANWAAAVLRDWRDNELPMRSKTTFSQNTARSRGWPVEMYREMLSRLTDAGLLQVGPNSVPIPTNIGMGYLHEYLSVAMRLNRERN